MQMFLTFFTAFLRRHRLTAATSTHDTKRGEDARARLAVLSELAAAWEANVKLWSRALREVGERNQLSIDPNDEYAFYPTLLGSWRAHLNDSANLAEADFGATRQRVTKTMLKIIREAKAHTRWSNPDAEYEEVVARLWPVRWMVLAETFSWSHSYYGEARAEDAPFSTRDKTRDKRRLIWSDVQLRLVTRAMNEPFALDNDYPGGTRVGETRCYRRPVSSALAGHPGT